MVTCWVVKEGDLGIFLQLKVRSPSTWEASVLTVGGSLFADFRFVRFDDEVFFFHILNLMRQYSRSDLKFTTVLFCVA